MCCEGNIQSNLNRFHQFEKYFARVVGFPWQRYGIELVLVSNSNNFNLNALLLAKNCASYMLPSHVPHRAKLSTSVKI